MEKTLEKIKAFKHEFFGSSTIGGLASYHLLFINTLHISPFLETIIKGVVAIGAAVASGVLTVMFNDFYKQVVRKRLYKHFKEDNEDDNIL